MAQDTRKLVAIVAADVANYSRLMGEDEGATHAAMKTIRKEVIDVGIAKAGGRLVNTAGDSFLIEFSSVVVAVGFAMELQVSMAARNDNIEQNRQIIFRVGVNIGDIIVDGDDIHGAGVNIAARLQTSAEPGEICIAQSVYEAIRGSLAGEFADGGELQLKNISHPVHVWRWSESAARQEIAVSSPRRIERPIRTDRREELRRDRPVTDVRALISRHKDALLAAAQENPFIVFLCGPTLTDQSKPSARLRLRLKEALEAENFEVVLGEDDGLEEGRLDLGLNAQDNELEFISTSCNAVIVIADSVGSFCELGLFSWHFVHDDGLLNQTRSRTEFILLVDQKFAGAKSYLNEGPARAINGFGIVSFVDFATYDLTALLARVRDRRGIMIVDNRRGRPRKPRV